MLHFCLSRYRKAIFLPFLFLAACQANADNGKLSGIWVVSEIAGISSTDIRSTLEFSDVGRITGTGGCNRYTGRMQIQGKSVFFSGIASTQMMCSEASAKQEHTFFDMLRKTDSWKKEGVRLVFMDKEGDPLLRFEASSEVNLE